MLTLIRNWSEQKSFEVIVDLVNVWSIMGNITDESPINCQQFLYNGGMNRFTDCLKVNSCFRWHWLFNRDYAAVKSTEIHCVPCLNTCKFFRINCEAFQDFLKHAEIRSDFSRLFYPCFRFCNTSSRLSPTLWNCSRLTYDSLRLFKTWLKPIITLFSRLP